MTYANQLGKAAKDLVWRLKIEVAMRIDDLVWTLVPATETYWLVPVEGKPSRLRSIDVTSHAVTELEEKGNLGACEGQAGSWFFDTATGRLYVRMPTVGSFSEDPDSGYYFLAFYFWRLFCNGQRADPNEAVFNGKWYDPRLAKDSIPDLSIEMAEWGQGGVRQTWGELSLLNGDGALDQELADYIYENKIFVLDVGAPGDTDAQFVTVSRGRTGSTTWSGDRIVIGVEDPLTAED